VSRNAALALAVTLFVAAGPPAPAKGEALPWPLYVSVDYGRPEDGPQGWREEMERWLVSNLEAERCYMSVELAGASPAPESHLQVEIQVTEFEERQQFDVAQSTALDPDQPPEVQHSYTLRAEAGFAVRLSMMPGGLELRRKTFRLVGSHRPTGMDDPRYEVRFQLAQGVFNTVRGMVCNKKLGKEIAKAGEQAGNGAPAR
jgi:hypothetical protein